MKVLVNDFVSGMRPSVDATKINAGTYPLLINGRVRGNAVSTIARTVKQSVPAGKLQGIYGLEQYQILVVAGQLWYRDTSTLNGYVLLPDAQLSATVDQIHIQPVPSSTLNFKRALVGSGIESVERTTPIATSARGGLVMDGVGQDWVIYPTTGGLAARLSQTFAQWNLTNYTAPDGEIVDTQEYVPVGLFPIFNGQRVFKVGRDKTNAFTRILGSVSGRPLDWVVEITSTGDKPSVADRTAHAVAYEPLTALYIAPSQDTTFIACTQNRTFGVFADPNITIFGERFLRTIPIFQAGAVSHWGSVDVNGELTFISRQGIIGTMATTQEAATLITPRVSRNRIFSAPVALLIANTVYGAATRFDDYALYAMNTILGNAVVVYDMNLQAFVSVDQWEGVGAIRQFATTYHDGVERLWCYTVDDQVFECFAGEESETARLYIGDVSAQNSFLDHTLNRVAAKFSNLTQDTNVTIDVYRDRLLTGQLVRKLNGETPFLESVIPTDEVRTKTVGGILASTNDHRAAYATGLLVQWSGPARLINAAVDVTVSEARDTVDAFVPSVTRLAFIADSDIDSVVGLTENGCTEESFNVLTRIVDNINKFKPDLVLGGGDHIYNDGTYDQYLESKSYYARFCAQFVAAPGNHDLDTDKGRVFFNYYGLGETYKAYEVSPLVEVFFLNSGYTTAQGQILTNPPDAEPDGNDIASLQATWLRARLADSTARFKIVVVHHPPYTDDSSYSPGYPRLRWPYRAWGADLVLSGHGHNYQRMRIDDIPYMVVGTGGATLRQLNPAKVWPTAYAQDTQFGHGQLTINEYSATWEFVAVSGEVLDKLTIRI